MFPSDLPWSQSDFPLVLWCQWLGCRKGI